MLSQPRRRAVLASLSIGLFCSLSWPGTAVGGVEDWQVSEVHLQSEGNPQLRFVELVNEQGGCLFPTSTLDLYDSAGALVDIMSLALVTTCYGAPTYLLLATPEAASYFGVDKDGNLTSELPSSGQLCFASSATRYDCVRWGSVPTAVVDLFGASDLSVASAPADGFSLSRAQTTHVVAADWASDTPSPRAPNDGSIWVPPDAGPTPDASPAVDAGPIADAAMRSDARAPPDARADAQDTRYLDLDAVGGADCSCQHTRGSSSLFPLLIVLVFLRRRR